MARQRRMEYLDNSLDDIARVGGPAQRLRRHQHHPVASVTAAGACVDCGKGPCRWNLLNRLRSSCMVPRNADA